MSLLSRRASQETNDYGRMLGHATYCAANTIHGKIPKKPRLERM
jgi:hypothetical protein